jgi:hypothetical protein
MYDDVMYVWAVKCSYDKIHAICVRQDVAEYMRDYFEAKSVDEFRDSILSFNPHHRTPTEAAIGIVNDRKFHVAEEEVLV